MQLALSLPSLSKFLVRCRLGGGACPGVSECLIVHSLLADVICSFALNNIFDIFTESYLFFGASLPWLLLFKAGWLTARLFCVFVKHDSYLRMGLRFRAGELGYLRERSGPLHVFLVGVHQGRLVWLNIFNESR